MVASFVVSNLSLWNLIEQLSESSGKTVVAVLMTKELAVLSGVLTGLIVSGFIVALTSLLKVFFSTKKGLLDGFFLSLCVASFAISVFSIRSKSQQIEIASVISSQQRDQSSILFDPMMSDELIEFHARRLEEGDNMRAYMVAFRDTRSQVALSGEIIAYSIGLYIGQLN